MEREIAVKYLGPERGRGVVALQSFARGVTIEVCPVLFVFQGFHALGDKEDLSRYELAWGPRKVAIAGGLAHFYNHSDDPNVAFDRDLAQGQVIVHTLRAIRAGDELCHRYACKPWWKSGRST